MYYYKVYLGYGYGECVYSSDEHDELYDSYADALRAGLHSQDKEHFIKVFKEGMKEDAN